MAAGGLERHAVFTPKAAHVSRFLRLKAEYACCSDSIAKYVILRKCQSCMRISGHSKLEIPQRKTFQEKLSGPSDRHRYILQRALLHWGNFVCGREEFFPAFLHRIHPSLSNSRCRGSCKLRASSDSEQKPPKLFPCMLLSLSFKVQFRSSLHL